MRLRYTLLVHANRLVVRRLSVSAARLRKTGAKQPAAQPSYIASRSNASGSTINCIVSPWMQRLKETCGDPGLNGRGSGTLCTTSVAMCSRHPRYISDSLLR